jgi:hypothetical protein
VAKKVVRVSATELEQLAEEGGPNLPASIVTELRDRRAKEGQVVYALNPNGKQS